MLDIRMIERGLAKPGKTKGGLAAAMGVRPGAVSEILPNPADQGVRTSTDHRLSRTQRGSDHGTGRRGRARSSPELEQMPPEGLGEVELPFPIAEETIAFEVVGNFDVPKYENGDIIVVYREQRHPLHELLWRGSGGAAEERRALSQDHRARKTGHAGQPDELQRQADIRRQAGMDRGNLRDLAKGPDRAPAGRAAGRSRRKLAGAGNRDGKATK